MDLSPGNPTITTIPLSVSRRSMKVIVTIVKNR